MRLSLNSLGIILGISFSIVYAAISLGTWHAGVDTYVAYLPYMTFIWTPLTIVLAIAGGLLKREGYLSFKRALQYAFLAFVVYEVGYGIVNVVIYDILDKTWNHQVSLVSLQNLLAKSIKLGLSTDQISDSLAKEKANPSGPLTFMGILIGFGQGILMDFVKSMVVALVIQRRVKA